MIYVELLKEHGTDAPPLAGIYEVTVVKSSGVALPGWRRSADRTRLHANSLLTATP